VISDLYCLNQLQLIYFRSPFGGCVLVQFTFCFLVCDLVCVPLWVSVSSFFSLYTPSYFHVSIFIPNRGMSWTCLLLFSVVPLYYTILLPSLSRIRSIYSKWCLSPVQHAYLLLLSPALLRYILFTFTRNIITQLVKNNKISV